MNVGKRNMNISLCTECFCMTKTIDGRCGKCNAEKPKLCEHGIPMFQSCGPCKREMVHKDYDMKKLFEKVARDSFDLQLMKYATPRRVQRKRTKGWRMPPNTVYVGRPSKWGNPFKTAEQFEHDMVFVKAAGNMENYIAGLRGKNLACWCPLDQPCHADVLLKIANDIV